MRRLALILSLDPDRMSGSWRRQGLTRIIVAWVFGSVFFNVTIGAPFATFARNLGAGDFLFGVLSAASMLGVPAQLLSAYLVERSGRRRRLFVIMGTLQRLVWIPIALLPWVIPETHPSVRLGALAFLAIFSSVCGNLGGPAWYSWMSDVVPIKVRGAFFANRLRVGTLVGLLAAIGAGAALDLWPGFVTYSLLFAGAAVCGVIDVQLFRAIAEPPMERAEALPPVWELFLAPLRDSTSRRYLVFWICFSSAVVLIGPSLWLYALESLRFSKLQANLVLLVAHMLALALSSRFWGRLIDRFGNRPVLRVCTLVMVLIPLGWVVAGPGSFWGLFLLTFVGGCFWAGIELANFNLILGLFPQRHRSVYMAVFGVLTGMAAALAPMAGGAVTDALAGSVLRLGPLRLGPYQQLFLASAALRLLAAAIALPRVREEGASRTRDLLQSVASDMGTLVRRRG